MLHWDVMYRGSGTLELHNRYGVFRRLAHSGGFTDQEGSESILSWKQQLPIQFCNFRQNF